jgi:predicted nucleic acid-binding Zn ribbon protein
MDAQTLAALEQAITPYRRAGFIITSQTEGAITLVLPSEKFSYLFFIITLILLWPVAVIYLVSHNNQKEKNVCVRITSQGDIEASGYTLEAIERERKRWWLLSLLFVAGVVILILLFLVLRYR